MKRSFQTLWYWLTHDTICKWCETRFHRAWILLPPEKLTRNRTLPRVTHGICAACMKRILNP